LKSVFLKIIQSPTAGKVSFNIGRDTAHSELKAPIFCTKSLNNTLILIGNVNSFNTLTLPYLIPLIL
jgi:hypothetical protein